MTALNELAEANRQAELALLNLRAARDKADTAQQELRSRQAALTAAGKSYGSLRKDFIISVLREGPAGRSEFRQRSGGALAAVDLEVGLVVLEDDGAICRAGDKWKLVTRRQMDSPTAADAGLAAL